MFKKITSFTQGIYCLHLIVYYYLLKFTQIQIIGFKTILVIYLISYYISFCGYIIVKQTKMKYLFI